MPPISLAFKEGQNLNFAIPSDEVTRALALLTKDAEVTLASVGVNQNMGRLDVLVDDAPLMQVTNRARQTNTNSQKECYPHTATGFPFPSTGQCRTDPKG